VRKIEEERNKNETVVGGGGEENRSVISGRLGSGY